MSTQNLLRIPMNGIGTQQKPPAQNKRVAQHYLKLFKNEWGGFDKGRRLWMGKCVDVCVCGCSL